MNLWSMSKLLVLVLLLHILDNRLTKKRLVFKLMVDLIVSLLKTLASFSKDFGVWMEWEKSDCASVLIGTVVQYEEVSAVWVLVWFSLEEVLTSGVSSSASTYARHA